MEQLDPRKEEQETRRIGWARAVGAEPGVPSFQVTLRVDHSL